VKNKLHEILAILLSL